MQPLQEVGPSRSERDDQPETTKKKRSPTTAGRPSQQLKVEQADAGHVEPVRIAASPSEPKLSATRSPGAYRGRCLYQSRKCENERAIKRNGKPHNLCEEHRSKQNQHQRKFDAKKFSRKRRRGSTSEDEGKAEATDGKTPSKRRPKHSKTVKPAQQETDAPSAAPVVVTQPLTYPPQFAGSPSHVLPMQHPPAAVYLPSPRVAYSPINAGSDRDVYVPRLTVSYSDYRPGACQGESSCHQLPHTGRPYIYQQGPLPTSVGYSQSELAAASILAQPSPTLPPLMSPPATSRPPYFKTEMSSAVQHGPSSTTPRVLPSLLTPHSIQTTSGMVPSPVPHHLPAVVTPAPPASVSPARSLGNVLPPLASFAPRKSPSPSPPS